MRTIRIAAPDIHEKDAVGNFCMDLASLLSAAGSEVYLYANSFSRDNSSIRHISGLIADTDKDDIIILSYSIFDPYLDQIAALPNRKICYFHGVTSPELLEDFEPVTAELCRKSYAQFPALGAFDSLIANSKFMADFLKGFVPGRDIDFVPPVFLSRFSGMEQGTVDLEKYKQPKMLVVGRVVPHKNVEESIRLFHEYHKLNNSSSLYVVGDSSNTVYMTHLTELIKELGLQGSVVFTGKVSDEDLVFHYKTASCLITTSRHEGFCIPVLEALYYRLKVVIKKGTAAEEIIGGLGILYDESSDLSDVASEIYESMNNLTYEETNGLEKRYIDVISANSAGYWEGKLVDK